MDGMPCGDAPLLIAGLGNLLMADDGVGVHAARALLQAPPPGATVVEVGTAVVDALDLFAAVGRLRGRVLVLDAVRAGRAPGTIYRLNPDERVALALPAGRAIGPAARALHDADLHSALGLIPLENRPAVTVLGIEPASLDYGVQLSPAVQRMFVAYVTQARWFAKAYGAAAWPARRPA